MKKQTILSTAAASFFACTSSALAHPGAPGHTHSGTEEWPFPDFSWPMVIAGSVCVLLAFAGLAYKKNLEK
jgi:hydrogenase/urease accessory protein HupE